MHSWLKPRRPQTLAMLTIDGFVGLVATIALRSGKMLLQSLNHAALPKLHAASCGRTANFA